MSKGHKPNKIWVYEVSKFYNRSLKSWMQDNDVEMYSLHNERKSVAAEIFIRTLKNKICKFMTAVLKNGYIDKLNDTFHRTIKMKSIDVKLSTYIDFDVENNDQDAKFKVADHARIFKYKNIFSNDYTTNWSEKVLDYQNSQKCCTVDTCY